MSPLFRWITFESQTFELTPYKEIDVVVNVEIPDGYRILSVIEFDVGALDSITLTQIRIDNVDKNITIGLCNTTEYQFTKSMYLDILFVRNNFISNAN